jgi:hypothetical protein
VASSSATKAQHEGIKFHFEALKAHSGVVEAHPGANVYFGNREGKKKKSYYIGNQFDYVQFF